MHSITTCVCAAVHAAARGQCWAQARLLMQGCLLPCWNVLLLPHCSIRCQRPPSRCSRRLPPCLVQQPAPAPFAPCLTGSW